MNVLANTCRVLLGHVKHPARHASGMRRVLVRASSHTTGMRRFLVITPSHVFDQLDLTSKKIIEISQAVNAHRVIPLNSDWLPSSPVFVYPSLRQPSPKNSKNNCHYYFGGLPALMQAARKLEKLGKPSAEEVVYVTDNKIPKTLQSGHQGHVHPSEWTAEECNTMNLIKTMLKGAGIMKNDDPADLAHYSYLHIPLHFREFLQNPMDYLSIYARFFQQRMVHNLTAKNGVSIQDRWICNMIAKSLAYHQKLSTEIEAETGLPTFRQNFRVYWSPMLSAINKKKKIWQTLGIRCEFMTVQEIMKHTLLKTNAPLHVLKIFGDGKFYPGAPERIASYLQVHYPNFTQRHSQVKEIHIDAKDGRPLMVVEEDSISNQRTATPVSTLFGSPGHSEVMRYDPFQKAWKRMWREVPVSGISSVWRCKIDRKEMVQRLGAENLTDQQLSKRIDALVAAANLSNLHVTTWNCELRPKTVEFFVRATQGANFNSLVACKTDLLNMRHNLDRYFIGEWDLISVGTCTRKTWVSNVPEFLRLHGESGFMHGHSGIGFSSSAAPQEDLVHP